MHDGFMEGNRGSGGGPAQLTLASHAQCGALTELVRDLAGRLPGARIESFPPAAAVYRPGDPTDHLLLVVEGLVRTSILGEAGQEFILHDYAAGEAFGELCFCEVRARQEQATALAPSRVARIGLAELRAFAAGDGFFQLLEMFTHRQAELARQLHELALSTVRERLVRFLARSAVGPTDQDGFCPVPGRMTHQEIAARIFTTREQVSAHLAALRREGHVRYGRGAPTGLRVRRAALEQMLP